MLKMETQFSKAVFANNKKLNNFKELGFFTLFYYKTSISILLHLLENIYNYSIIH